MNFRRSRSAFWRRQKKVMEALAEAALQSEIESGNPEQPESTETPSNVAQDASGKRGRGTALEAAKNKATSWQRSE